MADIVNACDGELLGMEFCPGFVSQVFRYWFTFGWYRCEQGLDIHWLHYEAMICNWHDLSSLDFGEAI